MITAIVLVKNEEKHIRRCIENLKKVNAKIVLVDSGSTDKTLAIAKSYSNVEIFFNQWINYAKQFNWAIDNCSIKTDWTLRIDADEYMDHTLVDFLNKELPLVPKHINGLFVKRGNYFLGRKIRYGDGKVYHLKIWRTGSAYCEEKWMDEHMLLKSGQTGMARGELVDHNLHSVFDFIEKHNKYSTREAIDFFEKYSVDETKKTESYSKAPTEKIKSLYYNFPIFLRPFLFYLHTLFVRGGIFDGVEGVVYHTLQKLLYRFLVDVKIFEAKIKARTERVDPKIFLRESLR